MTDKFVVRDSGRREAFDSGMVRDLEDDKPDFTLIDLDFLERWAMHMTRGAQKYGEDNWRLANSEAEYKRFRRSAARHLVKWLRDMRDEDHAAAVVFNLAAAEFVREKLQQKGNTQLGNS